MTISNVRIYFHPLSRERELRLTAAYCGFSEWFVRRLKPIREELRGPEAKGVDIVNLMLHENPDHVRHRDQWIQRGNTFEFEFLCDLLPLEVEPDIEKMAKLLQFYAAVAATAPWPQVRSLTAVLAAPLSAGDRITLTPYLRWPRGNIISESMARRMVPHAQPDEQSIEKWLRAAGEGRLESVAKLVEQGLHIDSASDNGGTALMSAARSYRSEVVRFLLEHGADVDARTHDGLTALHTAVGETPSLPERQAECVRLLLEAGANPDAASASGETPLMSAAWFGCAPSVQVLVGHGADVSILDAQGRTAKDLANARGHQDVVRILDARERTTWAAMTN